MEPHRSCVPLVLVLLHDILHDADEPQFLYKARRDEPFDELVDDDGGALYDRESAFIIPRRSIRRVCPPLFLWDVAAADLFVYTSVCLRTSSESAS